jgi:phosphatidylglycerophosphate synthase
MFYQPTSRRPIAGLFRRTAQSATSICVRLRIHPDAISYGSIVAAAGAAVCFWQSRRVPGLLIVGSALCIVRLWLNMLDGMVALAAGKASPRGEILNDLPDRVSDVLIFVGLAHSGLCNPFLGYWAAILALVTAYVGMLGQAVGAKREFAGTMSKPWRMAAVCAGALATWGMLMVGQSVAIGPLTIIEYTLILILLGCIETIIRRISRILRTLGERK